MTTANCDDDSTATCPPNPYEPPATALDPDASAPAVFRSPTSLYWFLAAGLGTLAAEFLMLGLMVSMMMPPIDPSLRIMALTTIVGSLVPVALAAQAVRLALAHREPLIRACREGLVVRAVALSSKVTTFYVPWPELVSAEVRGFLGRKGLVVLTRVEPYEIRFFLGDCVLRPRAVAAAIVALARDEATHVALPGWDRPPTS